MKASPTLPGYLNMNDTNLNDQARRKLLMFLGELACDSLMSRERVELYVERLEFLRDLLDERIAADRAALQDEKQKEMS